MIEYFSFGVVYAFACVVQPGPFQAYLVSQSLTNGWRRTLPMVFAPLISDGPIAVVAMFVLSAMPNHLLPVLQIAGGLLLLYLAYGAYKTWRTFDQRTVLMSSSQTTVMKAALVNFLNPGPYLGWSLVMAPMLLKGWRETPANGVSLIVGFYGTMIAGSIALVAVFSAARSLGQRVNRASVGLSVAALACFGLYQLWFGIAAVQIRAPGSTMSFSPLTKGVYVHTSYKALDGEPYPSNGLIVDGDSGTLLIDTPWDTVQTGQLLKWIADSLGKKVALCIITHAHEDRMGGIELLKKRGITTVSTPLTAKLASERGFGVLEGILPDDTTMVAGGTRVECYYPGKGHTEDNIVVWFPDQQVLFGGCIVRSHMAEGLGNTVDASLSDWAVSVQNVMKRFPLRRFVVPGHQDWKGNRLLEHTLDLLERQKHRDRDES